MNPILKEVQNMSFFDYNEICYHGTDKCNIRPILDTEFIFSDSDDEYLGTGVYFFERDILQAINWCTRAKKHEIEEPAVIRATIKTDNMIDLSLTIHYNVIYELTNFINKQYEESDSIEGEELNPKLIFNILYELKSYDAIKHVFRVPKGGNVESTDIYRVQIQICVRNSDVICDKKEVDIDGYL